MSVYKLLDERGLPPLLINEKGEAVSTPEQFEARRKEIMMPSSPRILIR